MKNNNPRTDWENEHLWSEGYRIRVAITEFVENIIKLTGIKYHIHIHTKTNVRVNNKTHNPDGIRRNNLNIAIAIRIRAKCRCGHELPGNPNFDDFWYE